MSQRFMEWRSAVFLERRNLLVLSGLEGVLSEPSGGPVEPEAASALRKLAELPGVDVAIVSRRPLSDLGSEREKLAGVWLIGDGGQSVSDPRGVELGLRRASPHGIREVMDRLPHGTALLVGVDERIDCGAIAAAHVRPTGLALHVARCPEVPGGDLADGLVRGTVAWIELLERLHGAIVLRDKRPASRSQLYPGWSHEGASR